jgi:hypothetical protein
MSTSSTSARLLYLSAPSFFFPFQGRMMNVIQLAKQQAALEADSSKRLAHSSVSRGARGPQLEDGEVVWYGDQVDPRETKPCILANGDKRPMTKVEQKLFSHTPYERGATEYRYEGQVRRLRPSKDPTDPRAVHREGQGIMRYPTGEMYEGSWKANKRHGEGFMSTPIGYRYTGEWKDDDLEGKGYETLPCKSAIDGTFANGVPEGLGVLLYVPNLNTTYRYEGEFKLGHRHGKGTIFYENGDTFVGMFDNGRRHGKGITTREVNGKMQQYVTEWDQGVLTSGPECVEKAKRVAKPKPTMTVNTEGNLVPADLTKWKVKDECTDLPLEHFLRIKLGFEKLDHNKSGSLSTAELTAIWGSGSQAMLLKLDTDGNGTIELDEIFGGWYPNVPPHNIARFMLQDINPKVLLRLRGYLCGVVDENDCGYMQVVGVKNFEAEDDPPLTAKHLENADYKIGFEKFTVAMYESAKQLCDPPHFFEVLCTWYPNISRQTMERYEKRNLTPAEISEIKEAFFELSGNEMEVQVSDFESAQELYQSGEAADSKDKIAQRALPGFFHEQPVWQVGAIRLSVALLKEVDKFDSKIGGSISLPQLLRFCYPNVRCRRMQEILQGKRKGTQPCPCEICGIA